MSESEKKAPSSSDSKEKNKSMLDDDIGKEFLSSWKSMSVAENDTMDFSFDTIPSGKKPGCKKNAFDFAQLDDMDFSLDNDFGKFNVDMPDLDFSSSTKKIAKTKDQQGELSSKNHKEKDGPFNFSFDFNDMDNFNLDSTFTKRENAQKSNLDKKIVSSNKSELRDSSIGLDVDGRVAAFDEEQNKKVSASESMLKSDKSALRGSSIDLGIDGRIAASDEGKNEKVSASGNVLEPDVETAPGYAENREVLIEKSPSNMFCSLTTSTSPDRNSIVSVNKEDQQVPFSAKTSPPVSSAKEPSQISLGQSLSGNDSSRDNVSNEQMEVDTVGSKLHPGLVLQHSSNDGMVTCVGSEHETPELKDSDSPYVTRDERTEAENDTAITMPKGNRLETEPVAHGSEIAVIPAASSRSIPKERTDNNSAEDRAAKISDVPESDQVGEKVKLIKERETGVVRSKFFKRSEETEPQVGQPLPVDENATVLESQGTAVLTLNSLGDGKRKDLSEGESHIGRNDTGDSKPVVRDSDKGESALDLEGREKNVKNLSNMRVGLTETANGSASKLPAKSRLLEKESNKMNSVMLGSTKLRKDLNNFSGDNPAISTYRTSEPCCQTSENSKTLVPSSGSKILSVGSAVKKTDLSSLRLLRPSISSKAQTNASQEFGSLKNSEQSVEQRSMELPVNIVSSKAQADVSQEFSTLKNAQKSVELPVKLVSRKAQADTAQEFSSLKNAQKSVERLEKLVSSRAQTVSSLEFSSLKNSQKSVGLPSSKAQADALLKFSSLENSQKSVEQPVKFVSSKAQTDASREVSSLENLKKNAELPIKFSSAATHPISETRSNFPGITSLKHKTMEGPGEGVPLNPHKHLSQLPRESRWAPSLKRKTLEGPTGEAVPLNPYKRLSQSPKESRFSAEPIKSAVDAQNNTNVVNGNETTSEQEMPMDVNVKEPEISFTMENDGNAEKAESYAKELENICNMLKKKHEEAKEIMVRAIVNNNSLLMLNHPIFDEKIRNVQKLLAKLTMSN